MEGAERLQQLLERIPDDRLVIDLRDLGFLDSMGLGVLLKTARSGRQEVRFVRGPTNVQRVFEITRTDIVLEWTTRPTDPDRRAV
jgi:anti-anti-sigma factor